MAEMPFEQEDVADATYFTVALTVLPLAGAETETPAKAMVPEHRISRRANFLMRRDSNREVQDNRTPVQVYTDGLMEFYSDRAIRSRTL
jgi:hypothetical protein